MNLAVAEKEDLEKIIQERVESILQQKILELNLVQKSTQLSTGTSLDEKFYVLNERIVRVEEELKNQRDMLILMQKNSDKRFEAMDKRFEDMQKNMDKRFEDMQKYMDKRFEAVDKRFEAVDKRFEAVDKRFEDMQMYMNKRFEDMDRRFVFIQWTMGIGFVSLGTLVSVMKIFG